MGIDNSSTSDIPLHAQRQSWDRWNSAARESRVGESSLRQAQAIEHVLEGLNRTDLEIIDVGCGTGWMCRRLLSYGAVTGTDLIDSALERARTRNPQVRFISGSIFEVDLPLRHFDVVVSLEVLAHVADQHSFIERLAALLKSGGRLALTTQNRPVFKRWSAVGGPIPGQIRRWVDERELHELLRHHFHDISITSMFPVGDKGFLRLVNSPKLNKLLEKLVSADRLKAIKEKAMLGHTLFAVATKR